MSDVLDPEEQTVQLLESGASGVHFFCGQKLEPFSWGRRAALQRLMQTELSVIEINAAIVYLCTLPAEKVQQIRGEEARTKALDSIGEWADKNGVRPGGEVEKALNTVADQIWSEYTVAQTEPDTKGGGASGES